MSDQSFETFIRYGTNAERLAFTPDPAPSIQPLYIWRETDTGNEYEFDTTWHLVSGPSSAVPTTAQGDTLYASAANTLTALAKDTNATRYLSNTGASNNPAWAQVALATGVSGDLPFANLTQGSALSVLGVTGNATADVASIAAGSDHQVLRRSGTAIAFGQVNLAQSAAVTGVLPVANGGSGASDAGPYRVATVTLTNDQYKALPTTGITVVSNPGAGLTIDLKHAYLLASFASGAYTGESAALSYLFLSAGGVEVSSYIANDNSVSVPLAYLTGFHDATKKKVWIGPTFDTSDAAAQWGTLTKSISSYIADNQSLIIKATNGGVDFGGGHASNTLVVKVWYTVEAC